MTKFLKRTKYLWWYWVISMRLQLSASTYQRWRSRSEMMIVWSFLCWTLRKGWRREKEEWMCVWDCQDLRIEMYHTSLMHSLFKVRNDLTHTMSYRVLKWISSSMHIYWSYRVLKWISSSMHIYWSYRVLKWISSSMHIYWSYRVLKWISSSMHIYWSYRVLKWISSSMHIYWYQLKYCSLHYSNILL